MPSESIRIGAWGKGPTVMIDFPLWSFIPMDEGIHLCPLRGLKLASRTHPAVTRTHLTFSASRSCVLLQSFLIADVIGLCLL